MFWVVLVLWMALLPLLQEAIGLTWFAHPVAVLVLALLTLARLLRRAGARGASLRAGPEALCPLVALLSLGLAIVWARPAAPRSELYVAGLTGLAHASFFLLCFAWLPGPAAGDAELRTARRGLATLLGLVALGQLVLVLREGQLTDPLLRPDGSLGNPNALGTLAGASALALVGLLRLRRWGLAAVLPLLLLAVLTRSRGALLATGVTLLLLAVHWKLRTLLLAVAAAAVLMLVVPNPLRDRVMMLESGHAFTRPFLWENALQRCATAPLGIGPGMNRYDFPPAAWDPEHPWLLHQRHTVGLTHNVFLTLTLEWGWLAGCALVGLTVWAATRLLSQRLRDDDPLCLGGALGACVLFLELQVDGLEQQPLVFSVFLLLLATALARVRPAAADAAGVSPAAAQTPGVRVPRWAAAGALLLVIVTLGAGVAWRARAAPRLQRAARLVEACERAEVPKAPAALPVPDEAEVRAALHAAEAVRPAEAEAAHLSLRFEISRLRRLLREAATAAPATAAPATAAADDAWRRQVAACSAAGFAALDRARALNGLDPDVPTDGAALALLRYRRLGKAPEDLLRYMELKQEALALDPLDVEARFELAQEARQSRQAGLMELQLAEAFRLEPDYAFAWYVLARLADAEGAPQRALYCYVRASESVLNCQLKAQVPNTTSAAFYQRNLDRVDLVALWVRIWELRRELYF